MISLEKSYDFFNPDADKNRIHIIGCGSVGSTIAENLARCGITKMTLYDFDVVEAKNVHNQMFTAKHIGMNKAEALADILKEINPGIEDSLVLETEGWTGKMLQGYIFLAADSMKVRRGVVELHKDSPFVKAVFDVRTLLTGAQHYAADWSSKESKEKLLSTMNFTDEEAKDATPVSACGATLGIVTTVRLICAIVVNNYIKFTKNEGLWEMVIMDGFSGFLECM